MDQTENILSPEPDSLIFDIGVPQGSIKEGIEQELFEIVRGKNFALNYLSWKFTEMIMITNKVILLNLVVVR